MAEEICLWEVSPACQRGSNNGPDFVSAKDDFGTDLAISTRKKLDPGDVVGTLCNLISLRSV